MLHHILPLIPEHSIYVEPFFGGGAVYWAKQPARQEVINDVKGEVVNFYEVLKTRFDDLQTLISRTPYARKMQQKAKFILQNEWLFAELPLQRAWAFYVAANQSFSSDLYGAWSFSNSCNCAVRFQNKKIQLSQDLVKRLENTDIECKMADQIISRRDTPETFVYADPPYLNADQSCYSGYTNEHFRCDLDALAAMKGKFLLSCYPSSILDEYVEKYSWDSREVEMPMTASLLHKEHRGKRRKKIEVLTANYPLSEVNYDLFSCAGYKP